MESFAYFDPGDQFFDSIPDTSPVPGDPGSVLHGESSAALFSRDTTEEAAGTTHLSIVDEEGNAVSMTATVEGPFGTQRWVAGFLLNNELNYLK